MERFSANYEKDSPTKPPCTEIDRVEIGRRYGATVRISLTSLKLVQIGKIGVPAP